MVVVSFVLAIIGAVVIGHVLAARDARRYWQETEREIQRGDPRKRK